MRWRTLFAAMVAAMAMLSGGTARADGAECGFYLGTMPHAHPWILRFASQRCEERDRFTVDGHQYVFVDVVGHGTPRTEARRRLSREAVERAVNTYRRWFQLSDALIVSGYDPAIRDEAYAYTSGDRFGCVIWLDRSAAHAGRDFRTSDVDQFKRTIAHELFHCAHLSDTRLDNVALRWRDEGAAEMFSGLAIPESRSNPAQISGFTNIETMPLYELEFDAYPFFAYLHNKRGVDAVVDMMRRASRSHTPVGDRTTLRNVTSFDDLFHDLARDYTEGKLKDENGRSLGLPQPALPRPNVEIDHEGNYPVRSMAGIHPFSLSLGEYTFKRGMTWKIADGRDQSKIRSSWVERDTANWQALPTEVMTCAQDKHGYIVTTSTAERDGPQPFSFDAKDKPGREAACQCPQGVWQMGTEALRATAWASRPGRLEGGNIVLTFGGSGEAKATFNYVTYVAPIDRDSSIRTVISGSVYWKYRRLAWNVQQLGGPAPTGPSIDAFGLERELTTSDAQTRVDFLSKGSVVGSKTTPFKVDQTGGGKNLVAAYCESNSVLNLIGSKSSVFPGSTSNPPYTGVFRR